MMSPDSASPALPVSSRLPSSVDYPRNHLSFLTSLILSCGLKIHQVSRWGNTAQLLRARLQLQGHPPPVPFNLMFLFFFFLIFIYLFMAVLGLRFCARAFSRCGKWGPLFITVRGPLTIVASLVAEYRLQTRRLSSCGSRAQLLHSMWDLPGPGLEPVSPALAGGFLTTAPPGKPLNLMFLF